MGGVRFSVRDYAEMDGLPLTRDMNRRSRGSYKHRVLKRLRRRALKFESASVSLEERHAWKTVIAWIDSFTKGRQSLNNEGVIVIHGESVRDL
ncbi:MAG: hypothetical protein LN413_00405 [Candidatus Thermoplasmatota archaeon]|nr:hypothetical protein [Candidatus Thermoplasmatota archaeon]